MKNFFILAAFLLLISTSCKKAEPAVEPDAVVETPAAPTSDCYKFATDKDTVTMTLTRTNNSASGELTYDWFEKDGNVGTYEGSFKGDTLRIGYTFQSEGMTSVREELFLLKGDEMIKGHGKIIDRDGKHVFKNRKNVIFDRSLVLSKTNCKGN